MRSHSWQRFLTPWCRGLAAVLVSMQVQAGVEVASAPIAPVLLTTGDNYPPFTGSDLPAGGLVTDIVREAFRKAGIEVKIDWLPWARGLYEVRSGSYAATFPYIHSPERDGEFVFSDPLLELEETLFIRKGLIVDPRRSDTLRGRIFCQPVGWALTPAMQTLLDSKTVVAVRPPDIKQCVKMLGAGHADFFDSDLRQGLATLAAAGAENDAIQALSPPLRANGTYLIVSRYRPGANELIEKFNRGLKVLRADGGYDRIVAVHARTQAQPPSIKQ